MQDLKKLFENFNIRKITPAQAVVGVIGLAIVVWVMNFIINLAMTLLPFAILAVIAYFGYSALTSKKEEVDEKLAQIKRDESLENAHPAEVSAVKPMARRQPVREESENNETLIINDASQTPLRVETLVNPETGIAEPNISRLEELERAKQAEAEKTNAEVQAQLEERRKRLGGQQ